ncbi:MAG TPA: LuxR C-terminal-related transcriptional regulator [Spirochaetia bacterium]|nr:LuxR C-terminal-related transcriptional regulator [Spirochaetia bacterium]
MNASLLSTKIRVPSPPRALVPRPALMARLEEGLAAPLVLVSAPAGFGKTSLAAEFLASLKAAGSPVRAAWLSLDAEDDDPVRFWAAVAAALDKAAPDKAARGGAADAGGATDSGGASPFASLAADLASLQPPPVAETTAAILEAAASSGERYLLVLDDFHLLSSSALLGSFARFVERLPEGLRLVVLSRADPRLPLPRLRARGAVAELRADDLRFGPEEAERFLAQALGGRLTGAQAQAIDEKAEGWAAGLQMAALSLSRRADPEAFIRSFSGSDRFVLEFLVEEVLAAQAPWLRDFLFASSVLDRFCAPLLDAVLPSAAPGLLAEAGSAEEALRRLDAANLFLVPLDDEGLWFRYHHLFADALRARGRSLGGAGEAGILRGAASWHEERGELEAAAGLLLRAGERGRAADLLARIAYGLLARGERATLESRIAQVGEAEVLTRPELAEAAGWARVFSGKAAETDAFLERLEAAAAGLPEGKARDDLSGAAAAMRAFASVQRGLLREAEAAARMAESLLGPDRHFSRNIVPFVLGSCARMRGDLRGAEGIMREFLRRSREWGDLYDMMMAYYEVCLTARQLGRLGEASEAYREAMAELARRGARGFGSACKVHGNYGEILYERGELDALDALLEGHLDGGGDWNLPTDILVAMSPAVKSRIARGRLEEARGLLLRAEGIEAKSGTFPRIAVLYRDLRARLSIAEGSPAAPPPAAYPPELVAVAQAARATDLRVLLASGSPAEAAAGASALAAEALSGGGLALFVEAKALEAAALAEAGEEGKALAALGEALAPARGEGFVRSLVDAGEGMRRLLALGLEEGRAERLGPAEAAYARRLLASFPPNGEASPGAARATAPEGLASARELEVLALLAEGLGNKEIASRLFISEGTVKTHVHHLAEKLEAKSRGAIVVRARALGLL